MCNTLNIKALELYCNIKKWNIELDTLLFLFIDILLLIKLCLLMEGPRCPQHQVEYMRASLLSQSKREAKE